MRGWPIGGLARDCHGTRFPRVWAVLHPGFPLEHSSHTSSPLRLPVSPRPRDPPSISSLVASWKESSMSTITAYHAHVYFDAADRERAQRLCAEADRTFGLSVGRMHDKPVGPHPRGSCQLAFGTGQLGEVIPWLILNRRGLTVFAHALTGDALKDHTDHVLWLGPSETLDLSALS